MRLFLFGTSHEDPRCPSQLSDRLEALKKAEARPPAYVAVEFDESHFNEIVSQRDRFIELARIEWPNARDETLRLLARTLAFEAAEAKSVFPLSKIVWLDQGRGLPEPDSISRFAEKRIAIFSSFLGSTQLPDDPQSATSYLGSAAQLLVSHAHGGDNDPRDEKWVRMLEKEQEGSISDWGVVVVGAHHIELRAGALAGRLDHLGYDLTRVDLSGAVNVG